MNKLEKIWLKLPLPLRILLGVSACMVPVNFSAHVGVASVITALGLSYLLLSFEHADAAKKLKQQENSKGESK